MFPAGCFLQPSPLADARRRGSLARLREPAKSVAAIRGTCVSIQDSPSTLVLRSRRCRATTTSSLPPSLTTSSAEVLYPSSRARFLYSRSSRAPSFLPLVVVERVVVSISTLACPGLFLARSGSEDLARAPGNLRRSEVRAGGRFVLPL